MKHIATYITVIGLLCICPLINAQQEADLSDLQFYADALSNTTLKENRQRAHETFQKSFLTFLEENNSFTDTLPFLPWVSTLYSPDSTFRIFTWELKGDPGEYWYYGFLQKEGGKPIPLKDRMNKEREVRYSTVGPDQWYGAKYYQIFPFALENGDTAYVLMGYDGYSKYTRRRIAETMKWRDDGTASFGLPVFGNDPDDIKRNGSNRLLMDYSLEVRVTMRVEVDSSFLIKDHMIPVQGQFPGQGSTMVPDGSYEGYRLMDGYWIRVDKVYDRFLEKPPVNLPAEAIEQYDLFGQKKRGG